MRFGIVQCGILLFSSHGFGRGGAHIEILHFGVVQSGIVQLPSHGFLTKGRTHLDPTSWDPVVWDPIASPATDLGSGGALLY